MRGSGLFTQGKAWRRLRNDRGGVEATRRNRFEHQSFRNILILGCGTCVTVCLTGGEREAQVLSHELSDLDSGLTDRSRSRSAP